MDNGIFGSFEELVNHNSMNLLKAPKQSFDSLREIDNLIYYITRSRKNDKERNDLISYGARGLEIEQDVSIAVKQWKYVQQAYKMRGNKFGRRCYHEIYCLNNEFSRKINRSKLDELGYELSEEYWGQGYQVVYGIHQPDKHEKRIHIHFAVNTVCLKTGKKWHDWFGSREIRNQKFDTIARNYL